MPTLSSKFCCNATFDLQLEGRRKTMKKTVCIVSKLVICLLAVFCIGNTTCAEAKTVKVTAIKVTNIDYSNFYLRIRQLLKSVKQAL